MSALVHRKLKLLLVFISVLAMTVLLISSCWLPDSRAETPGYRLFTGRTEGLRISFEYPETWQRRTVEKLGDSEVTSFLGEGLSGHVSSYLNAAQGGDFENARALQQDHLEYASNLLEFKMISQGKVFLGNVEGEELSYSYRMKAAHVAEAPPDYVVDKVEIWRYLTMDYGKRIYEISLLVDADKYEGIKEGFEHLLATFRFLK